MIGLQTRIVVVVLVLVAHVAASGDGPCDGADIAKHFKELEQRLRDHEVAIQGLEKKTTEQESTIQTQQRLINQLQNQLSTESKKELSNERQEGIGGNHENGKEEDNTNRTQTDRAHTPTKRQERAKTAFTAFLDHNIDTGHQPVKFNKIITNEGSSYNIYSGVFTCMEPGVYIFIFNIGERGDGQGVWANLLVNNQEVVGAAADAYHSAQDVQGGNAAFLRLNAGDVVWVESHGGHIEGSSSNRWTSFSGAFLFP